MSTPEELATRIIRESNAKQRAADAVLREQLKTSRLPRAESAAVAHLVFAYYRWRGWLKESDKLRDQLHSAQELAEAFAANPHSFTTHDLRKAIPIWVNDEIEITRDWLVSLQTPPSLWLRAKRGTADELASDLGDCQAGAAELRDALRYLGEKDLFRTPEFHAGAFEVQDIASQVVGLHCAPNAGETWWDACAGEGGKMLHLSDLMQNRGLIWASDRSERRLAKLRQRAARAKVFNYRVAHWDGSEKLPTKTKFDGVLVDAPCSGIGTWRRNPHARWATTVLDVREMAAIQQQLLLRAARAVKPGGKLIYAVCTLARRETTAVADLCSPQLPGFAPLAWPAFANEPPAASGRRWILSQTYDGNGMFLAGWKRFP
jgi:16S rRNA (cytosine967-C5)-methyltransferase